jgi:hypothetical protein
MYRFSQVCPCQASVKQAAASFACKGCIRAFPTQPHVCCNLCAAAYLHLALLEAGWGWTLHAVGRKPAWRTAAAAAVVVMCRVGLWMWLGIACCRSQTCMPYCCCCCCAVLDAGWGWSIHVAAAPVPCPVGSYSTGGLSSLVPCLSCPSELTTNRTGATSKDACSEYFCWYPIDLARG